MVLLMKQSIIQLKYYYAKWSVCKMIAWMTSKHEPHYDGTDLTAYWSSGNLNSGQHKRR